MKTISIITLLLVAVLLNSCKKEFESDIERVEVNITLTAGSEFRYELTPYIQKGEFPLITKPPAKYIISRINYDNSAGGTYYQYVPDMTASRNDNVIIKIIKEHEHNPLANDDHWENDNYTSAIITINFSIQ